MIEIGRLALDQRAASAPSRVRDVEAGVSQAQLEEPPDLRVTVDDENFPRRLGAAISRFHGSARDARWVSRPAQRDYMRLARRAGEMKQTVMALLLESGRDMNPRCDGRRLGRRSGGRPRTLSSWAGPL